MSLGLWWPLLEASGPPFLFLFLSGELSLSEDEVADDVSEELPPDEPSEDDEEEDDDPLSLPLLLLLLLVASLLVVPEDDEVALLVESESSLEEEVPDEEDEEVVVLVVEEEGDEDGDLFLFFLPFLLFLSSLFCTLLTGTPRNSSGTSDGSMNRRTLGSFSCWVLEGLGL